VGYGYRYRNAGIDLTLDPANVRDAAESAAGALAHGPLPPALAQSVARGIDDGTRGLRTLGYVAVAVVAFVALGGPKLLK
jgi:hypothetical protein